MLRIALLGCGRIGRMHAALVARHPGCELTLVCDPVTAAAEAVARETGAEVATSPDEVFASDAVDAVLVASVTATHADYIEAAVRAGKPVLCEKPIDLDIKRVRACRAAIAGSDVPVQIGFNRRFDPGHRALRDALAAGRVGRLVQCLITSRDPAPPSQAYLAGAGGMIRDMTIHDFDLARFILGDDEPVEVFALAAPLIDPAMGTDLNEVDCAMITLRTRAGRQVLINNARQASYGYDQRIEVLGTAGMLQSSNRSTHGLKVFDGSGTDAGQPFLPFFIERYGNAFSHQLDAFVAAVRNGTRPEVGFDDGLLALEVAEAAYRSIASGRAEAVLGMAG